VFSLKLLDIFESSDIGSRHSGRILREKIEELLGNSNTITLDFSGINLVTQSFIDEAIGVIIRQIGPSFHHRIHFKDCNDVVKSVITMVATYSLGMISRSSSSGMPFKGRDEEDALRKIEIEDLVTV